MTETTEQYRNRINQLKTEIETEPLIKEMRSDIAEGIHKTGNRQADIEVRQDTLEDDFVAVQRDASAVSPSGAEVAVARGGHSTLDERLTTKEQEVTAQLAQTIRSGIANENTEQDPLKPFLEITNRGGSSAIHLTVGSSFTGPYIFGLGKDNPGLGMMLPNKANGSMILGEQRATVTDTISPWMKVTQESATSSLIRLEQNVSNGAPLIDLLASPASNLTSKVLNFVSGDGRSHKISSLTGEIVWEGDITIKDDQSKGKSKLILTQGLESFGKSYFNAEANIMKWFGFTGTTGLWYPFALKRSGDTLSFQAGGATSNRETPTLSDVITIKHNRIGFFGATSIVKPIAVPRTLDGVYNALKNLGLIGE